MAHRRARKPGANMTNIKLENRVYELESAIRKHRESQRPPLVADRDLYLALDEPRRPAIALPARLVYLACPYSSPDPAVVAERVRLATIAAAAMFRMGIVVFSPITHGQQIHLAGAGDDHTLWMRHGLEMVRRSDQVEVLQLDGWETSKGVQAEIAEAKRLGIPVTYRGSPLEPSYPDWPDENKAHWSNEPQPADRGDDGRVLAEPEEA